MASRRSPWAWLLPGVLVITACSASPASTQPDPGASSAPPGQSAAPPGQSAAAASNGSGSSADPEPSDGDGGGRPTGGGAFAGDACDLLTTDEVESVYSGFGTMVAEAAPAETLSITSFSSCSYLNPDAFIVAAVVSEEDPQSYGGNPDAFLDSFGPSMINREEIDIGSGARGIWVEIVFGLYIFKGDAVILAQSFVPPEGMEIVDALTELAKIIAGRLP